MAARRIARLVAAVCLFAAASAQAVPPQPPLIANGDFENATLDPWFGSATLAGAESWIAASGTQSVELHDFGYLYQDVATTAGTRYDLTFSYAGNPGCTPGPKHLTVAWNGTLTGVWAGRASFTFDTTGHTTASMGWTTAHVLVDAASASTQPAFSDYDDTGCGIVVDNVTMATAAGTQTGTQLTTTAAEAVVGNPSTVTATVLAASSGSTPTGSVQFLVDGSDLGGPVALVAGQAQTALPDLPVGAHEITAQYAPDSASFSASSVTQRYSVIQAYTTTALNVDASPVPLGQEVVLTATVGVDSPGSATPTGTVQFGDEFGSLGDPVPVGTDGVAQVGVIEDVGYHYLWASYSGDENLRWSSGYAELSVFDPNPPPADGGQIATTTVILSSKNPLNPGEQYTVTATVSPNEPSDALLDGTITFSVNTFPLGDPVALDANRSATSAVITPAPGVARQTVRARYSGNASFLASTGSLVERIALLSPTTTITRPPPAPPDTQRPIFTVRITPARLARALRSGLRAHLDCNENCSASLRLTLTARQAKALGIRVRGKSLLVAEGSYDFADRRSSDVVVRFTSRARKALAKAKRVPLRLTTTVADFSDNAAVKVQALVLKR